VKLKLEEIYSDKLSLHTLNTDEDMEEIFLNKIYSQLKALNIKGFNTYATTTSFQGLFSKKVEILVVEFKKSKIKSLYTLFLVQNNGAVFTFRMYKCLHPAYVEKVTEKPTAQRAELLKNLFTTFEDRHDFSMFDTLMDKMFDSALKSVAK